jgi:hypothetical protein
MLELAIIGLAIGAIYAVYVAPKDQKVLVGAVLVVLAAAGYGAGFALTAKGTDQRTYYPIAGAVAGAMIAFGWISHRQKSWPKKGEKT